MVCQLKHDCWMEVHLCIRRSRSIYQPNNSFSWIYHIIEWIPYYHESPTNLGILWLLFQSQKQSLCKAVDLEVQQLLLAANLAKLSLQAQVSHCLQTHHKSLTQDEAACTQLLTEAEALLKQFNIIHQKPYLEQRLRVSYCGFCFSRLHNQHKKGGAAFRVGLK